MGPNALVVREQREAAPSRRTVYHARRVGYEAERQLWRAATGGWWTTETDLLADVTVSMPEAKR